MIEIQLLNVLVGIGATIATLTGAIWYKGAGESARWFCERAGVDLYRLAGGWETAIEREDASAIIEAYERNVPDGERLRISASSHPFPALIEEALRRDDMGRVDRLSNHLDDADVEEMLDRRGLWPDPIRDVAQLRDDRSKAYAWILSGDATEEDRASLAKEIEDTFVQLNQSEPEALHFVVRDVEEIKELGSETIEGYVKPWLKDSQHNDNEEENR